MVDKVSIKRIGVWAAASLVVSNMVGAGIFTTSGFLAENLGSPVLLLAVWALGGLLALAGASSYGELGASLPRVGGDYIYLRRAYGPLWAFLSGWMSFFAGFSAPIALTALGFVEHITPFAPSLATQGHVPLFNLWGLSPTISPGRLAAIAAIWLLTSLHYLGIRVSGRFQLTLTVVNISLILSFLFVAFSSGAGDWKHFDIPAGGIFQAVSGKLAEIAVSLIMVHYAYTGFNAAAFIAGEMENPGRNLPRALIAGAGLVTALYLALNLVYVYALPLERMAGKIDVAKLAATALTGEKSGGFFSLVIAVCVLACSSAMVCIGSRIYYAMAQDGLFFSFAGRTSPRFGTPGQALLLQAVWASALVVLGTFRQLLTYCGFMLSFFTALAVGGVFVLRRREPRLARPYRVWGYPFTPAVYLGVAILVMGYVIAKDPGESLVGIGLVSLGIPVYYLWKRKEVKASGGGNKNYM
jgi:APA family basic amino acid/polyamine antiporter